MQNTLKIFFVALDSQLALRILDRERLFPSIN